MPIRKIANEHRNFMRLEKSVDAQFREFKLPLSTYLDLVKFAMQHHIMSN